MLIYGSTKIDFSGADPYFIELFKKFLNDSKIRSQIEGNEWQRVYEAADALEDSEGFVGISSSLTEVAYKAGIDVMKYMRGIPAEFSYDVPDLEIIRIPSNIMYIGRRAFARCPSLHTLEIEGNYLKSIQQGAFVGCSDLRTVLLPSSLEIIEEFAFQECPLFRRINYGGTMQQCSRIYVSTEAVDHPVLFKCSDGDLVMTEQGSWESPDK